MNYRKLITLSLQTVLKRPYLWGLGFLAFLTEEGVFFYYRHNNADESGSGVMPLFQGELSGWWQTSLARAQDDIWPNAANWQFLWQWLGENLLVLLLLLVAVVLFMFVIAYLSLASKAGIIMHISELRDKKDGGSFAKLYCRGKKIALQLVLFYIIWFLLSILVMLLPFLILLPLLLISGSMLDRAFISDFIIAFVAIYFVFAFFVLTINIKLSEREYILNKISMKQAIKYGLALFYANRFGSIIIAFLVILSGFVYIAALVAILLLFLGAVLLVKIFETMAIMALIAKLFLILAIVALIIAIVITSGMLGAFITTLWTNYYLKIRAK